MADQRPWSQPSERELLQLSLQLQGAPPARRARQPRPWTARTSASSREEWATRVTRR